MKQKGNCTLLKQESYANKILKIAGMLDFNSCKYPMESHIEVTKGDKGQPVNATEYQRLIGSLRYLTHTRPDLSYAVGVASRFLHEPKQSHSQLLKHILRYVKGTVGNGLSYGKDGDESIYGY